MNGLVRMVMTMKFSDDYELFMHLYLSDPYMDTSSHEHDKYY